ncbi:hypothetical protein [Amycolatopsis sp. lyj-112]|uniref:hypothetical protein n=1 Tax=Amycolatopsis sp. lyj-112 TaxID=2789288 RepID=UPI00397AAA5F
MSSLTRYRSATVLLAACGVALAVPSAGFAQDDYPFLGLSPRQSKAGEEILVSVGCPGGDLGEVKSVVLDRLGKFEVTNETPVIQGAVAHINDKARPGFYAIKAICKKKTMTANLEIVPAKPPTPTSAKPPKPTKSTSPVKPTVGGQVSKIPVGAPQTGGGATSS